MPLLELYEYMANKNDLIVSISEKTGLTRKDTTKVVNSFLETLAEFLKDGEDIQLLGFGTFSVKERAERKGRNPQTGENIIIPPHKAPMFKAGKQLKDAIK